jgi:uncharacterized protein (DUF3084 family)
MQINDVPAAVWTTISAIGVAVASGLFTAWASKAKTKADVQTVLNQGFSQLIDKLNTRIKNADDEADKCQVEIVKLRLERDSVRADLETVRQQNHDLRNTLMKNNIPFRRSQK